MQITENTTGMKAAFAVATDKTGRDHCVVVVKGTFIIGSDGEATLAEEQQPMVHADEHHGDPADTSIKYESDFAPFKPRADILVNGRAMSPTGRPVAELTVGLKVGALRKVVRVSGDRRWGKSLSGQTASEPKPFVEMPLVWERAFGGMDNSHENPKRHGAELRNLVGVGFRRNPDADAAEGLPLPNLELPGQPMRNWNDRVTPVGLGPVGRGWQPRLSFAGTYDEGWLEHRFPFLPEDFDERHFQSAPADQQTDYFQGGEMVHCANMSAEAQLRFVLPKVDLPVRFRFWDREETAEPVLDTLIVEPDQRRFMLTWRTKIQLGRKLNALEEIHVGVPRKIVFTRRPSGKRQFRSIGDFIAWKNARS